MDTSDYSQTWVRKNLDFLLKNLDFLLKNLDFLIKNLHYIIKHTDELVNTDSAFQVGGWIAQAKKLAQSQVLE